MFHAARPKAGAPVAGALLALAVVALFSAGASPAATTAVLNEPTTPILDNFNRGLEDPLHQWGNWSDVSIGGSGPTMENRGGVAGHDEGSVHGDSFRTAASPPGDAEVYATISNGPINDQFMYLYLNLHEVGTPGFDGYEIRWFHWISVDGLYLRKIVDGVSTNLVGPLQGSPEPQSGDVLLLRRVGNTLQLWHKSGGTWLLRLSHTDPNPLPTGGRIGFGLDHPSGSWDNFGGSGSTTPEPPPPTLPQTPILDAFERPDEDPLSQGGAWASTPIAGSGLTLEVLGGQAGHNEGAFAPGDSYRGADVTGDAEVYATLANAPDNNEPVYLYLHLQGVGGAGWDGYRANFEKWVSTTPDTAAIQKVVDGQATTLMSTSLEFGNGDVFLLRRVGNGIELWRKLAGTWTKLMTTSDGSYTQGKLGLGVDDDSSRWDDFGGGALAPPPPPPAGPPPEQTYGPGENGDRINGRCGCLFLADPVNSRTGAFTTSVDDLDLPGTGVSFAWGRSYTSADATVGRLGPGWTDSYSAALAVQPNGDARLHGEDGQQILYVKQPNGSFVGAPGSLSTLASVAGGYELLRTDQVKYRFDTQGRLLSIKDRNEQGVTLGYDGQNRLASVTDAANRQATISYNASNLVSQVQTQDGRSVSYGYTAGRLTSVTDVRGKTWTYAYDGGGRLATMVDPLNHAQVTNVYGADGRVQSQTDALGKTTTFAWNAQTETATATDANQKVWTHDYEQGVLREEVDPLGNDTDLVLDSDLNTTAVTGPTDEQTQMTYDAAGNLLTATAPPSLGSAQKTFVYNARNDVELVTDARGKVTDYAYEPQSGNLASVTQDGVQVGSYTYDAQGRVLTFTDGNEKVWTYAYFPATGYLQSSSDPLGNTTTYTYDAAGRVATRVDPKGNVPGCSCAADFTWTYTYNAAGQLLTEQNPLGQQTTNAYDDAGRLVSTSDPLGRTTSYTYDDANRVLTETAPDPDGTGPLVAPVTTSTYDNVGNRLTETDPRGSTTTFAYEGANRLLSTTVPDPDGAGPQPAPVTTNTYDPNGNLASTVEPRGNVQGANPDEYRTTFTYDAAGRMLTETRPDPDGAGPALPPKTTNVYDPVGNLASVKDGNDHLTAYTYDAAGRILTVTGPDGGVTTYTYDDAGNMLTRRDDNAHTTTYAYDGAGRLLSETSPDPDGAGPQTAAVTSYTHDPNGNRLTVTDPNGNATPVAGDGVTTYGYDRANRQTSIDYADATPDVTFTYDAAGNRLTMADGSGTETRTYDALDRLLTVTRGQNTFSYVYDAASNVTRRTYPGGTVADYSYDPLNRLATAASSGNTTSYAYDPASNLVQTTLPSGNGYVESRVYDRAGRLTEVRNQKGASVLSHFLSTLDPVGNPTQVVRTGSLAETQAYTYDASDRLTGVCFQAGTCPGASDPFIRWSYDRVGNRLSEQRPSGTTPYTYDARDRLLSAGSTSFAYDQNGNQTQKGTRTFAYDLANRLKSTTQGSTTSYAYDGEGKRVEATGGGSPAAPTVRTPCATAIGTSGTATVNKPTGTLLGDLLVVGLALEKGSDVVITPPAGWTLIRRTNQLTDVGYATYRKLAGASEPSSYAFSLTNAPKWSIGACAIAGADTAAPIDDHAGASGISPGNAYIAAPSVTTTGPNRLLLAFYANKKPATFSFYSAPATSERWDAPNPGGLPSNAMASYVRPAAGATGVMSANASQHAEWVTQQIAISPASGASVIRFLWDVSQGLPQLALERDGSNNPLRSYVYGERRLAQAAGADTSYFHYDGLGSVAHMTSSIGATQWTYAYEPFGSTRTESSSGGPANFLKFTGEYLDPTGLYHLRARQYDPVSGRFLRPDPVDPGVGSPVVASYVYAGNEPIVMVDPSGETFQPARGGQTRARFASTHVAPDAVRRCQAEECGGVRRVYPIPKRFPSFAITFPSDPTGRHPTRRLPGYPGIDFRGRVNLQVPVVAVEPGEIRALSEGLGKSIYLLGDSGVDYYYTHLGVRTVSVGQRVAVGQVIGRIGKYPVAGVVDHLHLGANVGGEVQPGEPGRTGQNSGRDYERARAIILQISYGPRV